MAVRSIASLSLTFGLVSIPVKVYLATESSAAIKFRLMSPTGARLRQQYVADSLAVQTSLPDSNSSTPSIAHPVGEVPEVDRPVSRPERESVVAQFPSTYRGPPLSPPPTPSGEPALVERSEMVKGYEFQNGQFVLFTTAELNALEAESRPTIDIVSFIPERSVDSIYFDKAYFLAPDKRGHKPYSLLRQAMQETGRCALAKWAWRSKQYVVQIRPAQGGMVLQQLLYADEVRSLDSLGIELVEVGDTELKLAKQLIDQIAAAAYDPHAFVDEEKQRILAAIERKIAGREIVTHEAPSVAPSARVVDLVSALRASLAPTLRSRSAGLAKGVDSHVPPVRERKSARRATTPTAAKTSKARKA